MKRALFLLVAMLPALAVSASACGSVEVTGAAAGSSGPGLADAAEEEAGETPDAGPCPTGRGDAGAGQPCDGGCSCCAGLCGTGNVCSSPCQAAGP